MFALTPESWLSMALMILGAVTILLAVLMALVQKDYKRLLSFHAISQVGYMILGIGTAVPAGIVGGLFHMVNNALYKSCLFLTGGAVERQTGTTDLSRLGGLGRAMPVTMLGFLICALSISGVPPFNGFFSKELVYDGALERHVIFYIAALLGSFFTAASFLKLGHAAFFGKSESDLSKVKEAPVLMLLPIIIIAALCVIFGLWNTLPIQHLIQPGIGAEHLEGHSFGGAPESVLLVALTIAVLIAAVLNHLYGVKKTGRGLGAVDHIHYAPGLSSMYHHAEQRHFDPYEIGMRLARWLGLISFGLDRFIDWLYNELIPWIAACFTAVLRGVHNGSPARYLLWSVGGFVLFMWFLFAGLP